MSKMLRISNDTSEQLDDLAKATKRTKQKIVQEAIELLSREYFLKKTNRQYEQLIKEPEFKKELENELQEWDNTLLD